MEPQQTTGSSHSNSGAKLIGVALLVAVLIAAGIFAVVVGGDDTTNTAQQTTNSTDSTSNTASDGLTTGNNEGKVLSLEQLIEFQVPEGHRNSIDVALEVESDGTIISVNSTVNFTDEESGQYNTGFNEAAQVVVGKDIRDVGDAKIGNASLTTGAFYSALRAAAAQL